ncbi:PDR/VanB family oxidoreductase [Mycolicibacterium komossense]|uniref:Oxidoreductase n=1 Tax=Mycolicibacterium komossense TaxID=1779 RepID=A0ABT3CDC9_9MYCO|nr:PDR/VanB family oxidoreductase [Mycolicibacterium komossense]MCV7227251.1 oxidoreductase [Mycolicibacterium komossense]
MKLQVLALRWEAEDIISVVLRDPSGDRLPPWTPGAHLALTLPSGLVRQYSLCGQRDEPYTYTVAVLKVRDGAGGSREIHERLRVGELIEAGEPRNNFALEPAPGYLFLAGGIGVTPILAMVDSVRADGGSYRLLYGARSRAAMAFTDRLESTSRGTVELIAADEAGPIDIVTAMAASPAGTRVYCCGPPAMLSAVQQASAEYPELVVHFERFAAAAGNAPADRHDGPFEVELAQTGVTVEVGSDQTILDAVLAVAPDTSYSCASGFCGTCETKVLGGRVDHRDDLLTEDEQATNSTMMICVSRSLGGDRLTLDL